MKKLKTFAVESGKKCQKYTIIIIIIKNSPGHWINHRWTGGHMVLMQLKKHWKHEDIIYHHFAKEFDWTEVNSKNILL